MTCFLAACTLAYLLVELPFCTDLVDTLSSPVPQDKVHEMERTGRLVSGLALTLLAWSFLIPRWTGSGVSSARTLAGSVAVAVACVASMELGQRTFVDHVAESSDLASRRAAMTAAAYRHSLLTASSGVRSDDPVERAGVGISSSLVWLGGVGRARTGDVELATYAAHVFPAHGPWRSDVLVPAMATVGDSFQVYHRAWKKRAEALARVDGEALAAWDRVSGKLFRAGVRWTDASVNTKAVAAIRREGVYVPDGWDPRDRDTFLRMARAGAVKRIEAAYSVVVGADPPPPGLSDLGSFVAHPSVQSVLRRRMALGDDGPKVTMDMGERPSRAVHGAARDRFADDVVEAFTNGSPTVMPGGRLSRFAEDCVRLAVVPALAVLLSVVGALGHTAKFVNYLILLLAARPRWRRVGSRPCRYGMLATALACLVLLPEGKVPTTRPRGPSQATELRYDFLGTVAVSALGWAVRSQAVVYRAGYAVSGLVVHRIPEKGRIATRSAWSG